MQISPINYSYRASYTKTQNVPTFKGRSWVDYVGYKKLIHDTAFFRESDTDEFVVDYVKRNMSDQKEINIVCAGCATGEEAYTLAMHFDDMQDKVKIMGFDLSEAAIKDARTTVFYIKNPKYWSHNGEFLPGYYADSFLEYKRDAKLSDREKKYKEKFNKYFSEFDVGLPNCYTDKYKIYRMNENFPDNCTFKVGDIEKLDKVLPDNSADVLFCRNTLYHSMTDINKDVELPNAYETKKKIFSDIHRKLKPYGLFVFGEHEYLERIDLKSTAKILIDLGFVPIYTPKASYNGREMPKGLVFPNVWQKVN